MAESQVQDLRLDLIAAGDRPSIAILGLLTSRLLKDHKLAVLAVDALGRVQVLPPSGVKILTPPKVSYEDLDKMPEPDAIRVLIAELAPEGEIKSYLFHREEKEG